jgi:oxazoline/thiazoline synthase
VRVRLGRHRFAHAFIIPGRTTSTRHVGLRDALATGVAAHRANDAGNGNMDFATTTRFQLNTWVRILGDVDGRTFVRAGQSYARCDAPSGTLLRALSEPRSLDSLLHAARATLSNAALRWQLEQLVDARYVRAIEPGALGQGDAGPPTRRTRADASHVAAHESLEQTVQSALERAGATGIRAVSLDHYLAFRGLEALLEPTRSSGQGAWLPFAVFEGQAWLGPILGQPSNPCAQCLLTRLWHNHPVERFLAARGAPREQLFPVLPLPAAELDRALTWVQRRSARLLSAEAPGSAGLYRVDFVSGRESQHTVHRRPQCPRCGDADAVRRRMFEPPCWRTPSSPAESAEPPFGNAIVSRDGGLRTMSPESTYRRVAAQVDPLVGRVGSLGQVFEKSNACHQVFSATYHRAPRPGEELGMQEFSVLSGGKGRSPVQARTSALCEALERQCAQREGDEAQRSASYRQLAPHAVDPRSLLLFSETQYLAGTPAQQRRQRSPRSQHVPALFDVDEILDWSPAWSLAGARLHWVPTQYCLDGERADSGGPPACCAWDSNGCAAGNTLAEATLQGLLELVERDAVAIWWYNRLAMPALSFGGLSSTASRLIERHERLGRRCWALDLTHDLGVPVAAVVLEAPASAGFALGFGCHPVEEIALERAVLELEQVLDGENQDPRLFERTELENDRFLLPDAGRARVPRLFRSEPPTQHERDLEIALEACVERLCARGLEALLFDYSRPDVALHTVKVLVPGLRHFWPRFALGRLYDVPVHMRWSRAPLSEAELNPLPLLM